MADIADDRDRSGDGDEEQMGTSEAIAVAVRLGSSPNYDSGAMKLAQVSETPAVQLEPAAMPQYQLAYDAGLEPVIPDDHEEVVAINENSTHSQIRKMKEEALAEDEKNKDEGDTTPAQGAGPAGPTTQSAPTGKPRSSRRGESSET